MQKYFEGFPSVKRWTCWSINQCSDESNKCDWIEGGKNEKAGQRVL
jgi:hypothetical protein